MKPTPVRRILWVIAVLLVLPLLGLILIRNQLDAVRCRDRHQVRISRIPYQRRNPHFQSRADLDEDLRLPNRRQVARLRRVCVLALISGHERCHGHMRAADLLSPILEHRQRDDNLKR